MIPTTFVSAFAGGNLLQVLLVAVLFGYATERFHQTLLPDREKSSQ